MSDAEPCYVLDWDTRFWGLVVARAAGDTLTAQRVAQIDDWCRERRARCLFFLSRLDDAVTTGLAEDNDFRLVDVRLALKCSLAAVESSLRGQAADPVIRSARADDGEALQAIAGDNYEYTRFYYDGNFPRGLCRAFYETWIKVSLEGYAQAVLVAEVEGTPAGYVTCHVDSPTTGRIGLVGVSDRAQQRGLGKALVVRALQWFAAQGVAEAMVVTQGRNCAAQRLYQRCGFLTHSVGLWYHKWYAQ